MSGYRRWCECDHEQFDARTSDVERPNMRVVGLLVFYRGYALSSQTYLTTMSRHPSDEAAPVGVSNSVTHTLRVPGPPVHVDRNFPLVA